MIGVARYDRWPLRSEAEVAFFVDDGHRGRGHRQPAAGVPGGARPAGRASAPSPPPCCRPTSAWCGCSGGPGFDLRSSFDDGVIEVHFDLSRPRRPRPRSRPGPGGRRPRPCGCCWPPDRWPSSGRGGTGAASATPCCATCWPTSSPARCTRSTRTPTTWPGVPAVPEIGASRVPWTWPWSWCRRPRCPPPSPPAGARARRPPSSSPRGSPRRARRVRPCRPRRCGPPAATACGCSAPTASA